MLAEFIVRDMLLIGTEKWSDHHEEMRLRSEPRAEDPWAQLQAQLSWERGKSQGRGSSERERLLPALPGSSSCSPTASSVKGGWPGHTP